jgi:2,3-bisphosphoglycerate-dependent phosphoglycerate mutase
MAYLYLARHAKSEWNEKGLWTGWSDPHLSKDGFVEAFKAGEALKGEQIDLGYTGTLIRTKETLEEIKKGMRTDFPSSESAEINERNYGDFTGKNKWQIKEEVGEVEFQSIRRGWDHKIKNGETLKDVYRRAVPFFTKIILPAVKEGKNTIVVSSGNSLRAIVKYLEDIPDEKIGEVEIGMGQIYKYSIDENGKVLNKKLAYAGTIDKEKKSS